MTGKYDIKSIRNKLKEKAGGFRDPNEFVPPKAQADGSTTSIRFYVLPPLEEGAPCNGGVASRSMDSVFFVTNGSHWVNKRPTACPRIHDDESCGMCDTGFDMMQEVKEKKARSAIAKTWLPQQRWAVNIYFPNLDSNPPECRNKVMWFNAPKEVFTIWERCLTKDDAGDPMNPEAFGVFFDENEAQLFSLDIVLKNEFNTYTTSKFLTAVGKKPIASNTEAIQKILDQRFDLFSKFDDRDHNKINNLVKSILDAQNNPGGGFTAEEGAGAGAEPAGMSGEVAVEDAVPKAAAKAATATATATKPTTKTTAPATATATKTAPPKTEAKAEAKAETKTAAPSGDANNKEIDDLLSQLGT